MIFDKKRCIKITLFIRNSFIMAFEPNIKFIRT